MKRHTLHAPLTVCLHYSLVSSLPPSSSSFPFLLLLLLFLLLLLLLNGLLLFPKFQYIEQNSLLLEVSLLLLPAQRFDDKHVPACLAIFVMPLILFIRLLLSYNFFHILTFKYNNTGFGVSV